MSVVRILVFHTDSSLLPFPFFHPASTASAAAAAAINRLGTSMSINQDKHMLNDAEGSLEELW